MDYNREEVCGEISRAVFIILYLIQISLLTCTSTMKMIMV